MSGSLDHETCSALLADHLAGELGADASAAVEQHLRTCEDCRAERRALAALGAKLEPMTAGERSRLHSAVLRPPAPAAAPMHARGSWRARLAPALAAAATLAVLAVAGSFLVEGRDLGAGGEADRGEAAGGGSASGPEQSGATREADSRQATLQPQVEASAGTLSEANLRRLGQRGLGFGRAPEVAFDLEKARAGADQRRLAARLAGQAPTAAGAEQLRDCLAAARGANRSLVPLYAGFGTVADRPALATGFLYEDERGVRRYRIWVWPKGSCAVPLRVLEGRVAP